MVGIEVVNALNMKSWLKWPNFRIPEYVDANLVVEAL